KYDNGARPEKGRLTLYNRFTRYDAPRAREAALAYNELAREYGLTPTQLALAWVNQQAFTSSNLIGATTLEQLRENIASADVQLNDELIAKINAIHHHTPNPAP
ncbi:MAG: aldo/keto reductase, partial [Alcaligenes aquatilis]